MDWILGRICALFTVEKIVEMIYNFFNYIFVLILELLKFWGGLSYAKYRKIQGRFVRSDK